MKYVVIDIDGTLADETHRVDHGIAGNWDEYFACLNGDACHKDVFYTMHMLVGTVKLMLLTGRPERYRAHTEQWLHEHEVPYDYLIMRPDDDHSDSALLKLATLEDYFGGRDAVLQKVLFALEDRDKIVKAFRDYGIPCWQCREGRY